MFQNYSKTLKIGFYIIQVNLNDIGKIQEMYHDQQIILNVDNDGNFVEKFTFDNLYLPFNVTTTDNQKSRELKISSYLIFDDREGRKLENFNSSDLEKYSDYYQSIELKCPDLYHLSIYKSDMIPCRYNFCSKNICTCLDGVPASVCSENNQHECESCNDEYILTTDNKCKKGCRNKYICEDGTAFQEWECDDDGENDHHMLEQNPDHRSTHADISNRVYYFEANFLGSSERKSLALIVQFRRD